MTDGTNCGRLGVDTTPGRDSENITGGKHWKAPGHESLPVELLTIDSADERIVVEPFPAELVDAWNGGGRGCRRNRNMPPSVYTKSDRSNSNNYKGLTLLLYREKRPC